jgi:hypothetical protein
LEINSGGVDPEPFQIVKVPHRFQKDMDDHILIIQQNPSSPGHPLLAFNSRRTGLRAFLSIAAFKQSKDFVFESVTISSYRVILS